MRVFVFSEPVNMCKSFSGLEVLVKKNLRQDPRSGDMFLFMSAKQNYAKVLRYTGKGFEILARKLDTGAFIKPGAKVISEEGLKKILDQVGIAKVKAGARRKSA